MRFTASSLNTYADCPYRYFAQHTLKLRGAADPEEMEFTKEGEVAHRAIERWERGERRQPIGEVSDACFDEVTAGMVTGHFNARSRELIRGTLERFAAAEERHGETYRTPAAPLGEHVEVNMGDTGQRQPELTLADGAVVLLKGRMDRVDVAAAAAAGGRRPAIVVDYKYSEKGLPTNYCAQVEKGRQLQLPLYLLMLETLELEPAGAELYPLRGEKAGRSGIYDEARLGGFFRAGVQPNGVVLPTADQKSTRLNSSHRL